MKDFNELKRDNKPKSNITIPPNINRIPGISPTTAPVINKQQKDNDDKIAKQETWKKRPKRLPNIGIDKFYTEWRTKMEYVIKLDEWEETH